MNIKLNICYDGTGYHGWQEQQNAATAQGTLLAAIKSVFGDVEMVHGVSRTDSGVHAISYIANFITEKSIPLENIPKAINSHLSADIRVLNAEIANDDFHAQFDCKNKTYIYRICQAQIQSPFERAYSWHFPYELDTIKMQEAAKYITGTHDFSAFCASGDERASRVRTVNNLSVSKENGIITIEINADGFLYNMVRIIAGTLAYVGAGQILPEEIKGIIESKDRTKSGITAPAHGLFLKEAFY